MKNRMKIIYFHRIPKLQFLVPKKTQNSPKINQEVTF